MNTILIADDDKKLSAALAARLNASGYRTEIAHNGPSVFKMVHHVAPDLILLDIWMPGMGLEIARDLRRNGSKVPIIIMSASDKHHHWMQAQDVGASAFIHKPYQPTELLKAIDHALHPKTVYGPKQSEPIAENE